MGSALLELVVQLVLLRAPAQAGTELYGLGTPADRVLLLMDGTVTLMRGGSCLLQRRHSDGQGQGRPHWTELISHEYEVNHSFYFVVRPLSASK